MITIYFRVHSNGIHNPKNPIVSAVATSIPQARLKANLMACRGYEYIKAVDCATQKVVKL